MDSLSPNAEGTGANDPNLQDLAKGDPEAFWRLWKEHEAHLYRICLRQLDGVPEEAEDALSILMVKLIELLPRQADQIRNLRAWLTRITYNLCIDIRRELKRSKAIASIEDLAAMAITFFTEPPISVPTTSEFV